MKKGIKYAVIGVVALAIIGIALDDSDSGNSTQQEMGTQNDETILSENNSEQNVHNESEKLDKEPEVLELSSEEQEKNINDILDAFENSEEVPEIENIKDYEESIVYSCIQKRMQNELKKKVTIKSIQKCISYRSVYDVWFPNGKKKEWFADLDEEYNLLKEAIENMEAVDSTYVEGIEAAYKAINYLDEVAFYVCYEVEQSLLGAAVDFFSGEKNIYYYANDVIYNEFLGEYSGEEEYLISTDEVLKKSGVQYLKGYITESIPVEFNGGFERELPVFQVVSDADIEQIELYYENYLLSQEQADKHRKNIKKMILEKDEMVSAESKEFILANSNIEKLTKKQILKLSKKERWLAKNEIYARYGRKFDNEELKNYFNSTLWYVGDIEPEDFDEAVFNKVERSNIQLLAKYENM